MNFNNIALNVIETEAQAVQNLCQCINQDFQKACELILQSKGKLIVTGLGKSGLVGKKIAATLSSTGTPSIFLHPTEALHGDFGLIQEQDIVLAISHSGYTDEICKLLPYFKHKGVPLISITSQTSSPLALAADISICYGKTKEACILGLAPTTSTTLTIVLGDALAIALLEARKFNEQDFASNHPGGSLGKKFILALELAHKHASIPKVFDDCSIVNALIEISSKKLGMTTIVDSSGKLAGVITDGDIRRAILNTPNILSQNVKDIMNINPKTIAKETLAQNALAIMEQNEITSLIIVDTDAQPIGVIHIHDLLKIGFSAKGSLN
jgi:arabinose-5-phosphate isomerase